MQAKSGLAWARPCGPHFTTHLTVHPLNGSSPLLTKKTNIETPQNIEKQATNAGGFFYLRQKQNQTKPREPQSREHHQIGEGT
jgi:hypothetical protein